MITGKREQPRVALEVGHDLARALWLPAVAADALVPPGVTLAEGATRRVSRPATMAAGSSALAGGLGRRRALQRRCECPAG